MDEERIQGPPHERPERFIYKRELSSYPPVLLVDQLSICQLAEAQVGFPWGLAKVFCTSPAGRSWKNSECSILLRSHTDSPCVLRTANWGNDRQTCPQIKALPAISKHHSCSLCTGSRGHAHLWAESTWKGRKRRSYRARPPSTKMRCDVSWKRWAIAYYGGSEFNSEASPELNKHHPASDDTWVFPWSPGKAITGACGYRGEQIILKLMIAGAGRRHRTANRASSSESRPLRRKRSLRSAQQSVCLRSRCVSWWNRG